MDQTEMLRRADEMLSDFPPNFRLTSSQSETFVNLITTMGPISKKMRRVWMPVSPEAVELFKAATTSWFRRTCILAQMSQMRQDKVYRFLRYGYGSATVRGRILKACEEHGVPVESLALRSNEPTPKRGLARDASPTDGIQA